MITVEELQILLQCDATQAEQVLSDIESRVNAFVKNVEDAFKRTGGSDKSPINSGAVTEGAKSLDNLGKALDTVTQKAKEAGEAMKNVSGGVGISKKSALTEKLQADYKKLALLQEEYAKSVAKTGADSKASVALESKIANLKSTIASTTAALDKLLEKEREAAEVGKERGNLVDWSKVNVEYDAPSGSGKPLEELFADRYNGVSLEAGSTLVDPSTIDAVDEAVQRANEAIARTLELAGEVRNKLLDAFEAQGAENFGETLRNSISIAEREIDVLANKLIVAQKSGATDAQKLSIEKQLQKAIERAEKLRAKLEELNDVQINIEPIEPVNFPSVDAGDVDSELFDIRSALESVGTALKRAFDDSILGRFTRSLSRLGHTIVRTLTRRLIYGAINGIKQAFETLSESSESSAKALNQIKSAGSAVGASLATAVMPILKALAPVFYQIASAAASAANAIAHFFAVLTGQSSYTAISVKENMDSIASSAGGGGSAMKGLLADFDELNVIQSDSGGGGGGGGGSSIFDTLEKDVDPPEWMTWIQEHLGDIKQLAIDVGAAVLAWKIAKAFGADLKTTLGVAVAIAGAADMIQEFMDAWENGLDWGNLTGMISDMCVVVIGLGTAFGITGAQVGLLVSGIVLCVAAIKDWITNGKASVETLTAISVGVLAIGAALSLTMGWIPLIIAAVVALLTTVVTLIVQNWTQVKAWLQNAWLDIKYFFLNIADYVSQIGNRIGAVFSWLGAQIKALVLTGVSWILEKLENSLLGRILNTIFPGFSDGVASLRESIKGDIDDCLQKAEDAAKILETPLKWGVEWDAEDKKLYEENLKKIAGTSITIPVYFKQVNSEAAAASVSGVSIERNNKVYQSALGFASGGLVYGETFARIGEYVGARNNPEVVAPLSDLRSILASTNTGNSNGMTREQANTMIGLLQRVADKELTIEPSAELGRVTSQSLTAYGTI